MLYQTGYLTIVDYDSIAREYTLGFPNEEVKYGFVECLMPEFVADCGAGSATDQQQRLRSPLRCGQPEAL